MIVLPKSVVCFTFDFRIIYFSTHHRIAIVNQLQKRSRFLKRGYDSESRATLGNKAFRVSMHLAGQGCDLFCLSQLPSFQLAGHPAILFIDTTFKKYRRQIFNFPWVRSEGDSPFGMPVC